jgi:hypothetical protein
VNRLKAGSVDDLPAGVQKVSIANRGRETKIWRCILPYISIPLPADGEWRAGRMGRCFNQNCWWESACLRCRSHLPQTRNTSSRWLGIKRVVSSRSLTRQLAI